MFEEEKQKYHVCRQVIDFTFIKSDLLKELRESYFTHPVLIKNTINWNGTQTEFIEIVEFLQETKIITKDDGILTLKEAIYAISPVFNLKIKDIYSKRSKQKQRRQGRGTKMYQIWMNYQQNKT